MKNYFLGVMSAYFISMFLYGTFKGLARRDSLE